MPLKWIEGVEGIETWEDCLERCKGYYGCKACSYSEPPLCGLMGPDYILDEMYEANDVFTGSSACEGTLIFLLEQFIKTMMLNLLDKGSSTFFEGRGYEDFLGVKKNWIFLGDTKNFRYASYTSFSLISIRVLVSYFKIFLNQGE